MRERRKRYPELYPDWENTTQETRERAGDRCEHCNVKQHSIRIGRKGTPYFIYLVAAHIHRLDTGNLARRQPINGQYLMCLCATCHGRYDARWRRKEREQAKRRQVAA